MAHDLTHPDRGGIVATDSIDEVLAAMDGIIARARRDDDRCGYFAVLYRKVTAKVKEGVEAGFFDDAERMVRLDRLFADRYLDAVAARDAGADPTRSWEVTFAAGPRWRPLILQHLLVGINAHINLDLGIAVARCSPAAELDSLRRDYDRINAILASMIASVQRTSSASHRGCDCSTGSAHGPRPSWCASAS